MKLRVKKLETHDSPSHKAHGVRISNSDEGLSNKEEKEITEKAESCVSKG